MARAIQNCAISSDSNVFYYVASYDVVLFYRERCTRGAFQYYSVTSH